MSHAGVRVCTRCGGIIHTDEPSKAYVCIGKGIKFHPFDPCYADIDIDTIAQGLAGINRFGGHHKFEWMSVAEHSINVSRLSKYPMLALLHDAPEGLGAGDMLSPVKRHIPAYQFMEDRVFNAVLHKFKIVVDDKMKREVKVQDYRMLSYEQMELGPDVEWIRAEITSRGHGPVPREIEFHCWSPDVARQKFLDEFYRLAREEKWPPRRSQRP